MDELDRHPTCSDIIIVDDDYYEPLLFEGFVTSSQQAKLPYCTTCHRSQKSLSTATPPEPCASSDVEMRHYADVRHCSPLQRYVSRCGGSDSIMKYL
jgi:hypothetical protein